MLCRMPATVTLISAVCSSMMVGSWLVRWVLEAQQIPSAYGPQHRIPHLSECIGPLAHHSKYVIKYRFRTMDTRRDIIHDMRCHELSTVAPF